MTADNKPTVVGVIDQLIKANGSDAVEDAIKQLVSRSILKPKAEEYSRLLSPEAIETTAARLEAGITDVMGHAKAVDGAYGDKPTLMKRARELETEIKICEAGAMMQTEAAVLKNAEQRDAYRRKASEVLRREQAQVEGQIAYIDAAIAKAKEGREATLQIVESVRAIAHVQAELLGYLK
jgi:hypothetical protein